MIVLEIGRRGVHRAGAARPVDQGLVTAALTWIDDPVGLHDDRPVAVADMWRTVMVALIGDPPGYQSEPVVVVHPDDWPPQRVGRVVAAANAVADQVTAVPRGQWAPAADAGVTPGDVDPPRRRRRFRPAPVALTAAVVALLVGVVTADRWPRAIPTGPPTQTVVEGRIAVRIPAQWTVTRVTGGPGSRRVQAGPPADPDLAVHITQSYAPESTPDRAAEVLGRNIAGQPPGVFVDFQSAGRAAGRPAVTYREVRPGRVVDWSVVLVGSTLIGVGCQSPPARTEAVRAACEQAITSARESRTDPRR